MKRTAALARVGVIAALAPSLGACTSDPIHEAQVSALGPEAPGVPVGQYHRAGQPCGICHGAEGPAKTIFSVAGTIFSAPYGSAGANPPIGVDKATVFFVDDNSSQNEIQATNCVGNFWFTPEQWNPAFPIRVQVGLGQGTPTAMTSHIGREASCATCHQDPPSANTVGHVYLATQASPNNPDCPVSSVARGVAP
jgi:hypothetical protein